MKDKDFPVSSTLIQRHGRQMVGLLTLLTLTIFMLGYLEAQTMNAVRAYVHGESLWAKGQRDAVLHLYDYLQQPTAENYARFELALQVPLQDRRAREALQQPEPDWAAARAGLLGGGNHPDDVDSMIRLFLWLGDQGPMARAIAIWGEADQQMAVLQALAARIRQTAANTDADWRRQQKAAVDPVSARLNVLELAFSSELSDGARWMTGAITLVNAVLLALMLLAAYGVVRRAGVEIHRKEADLRQSEMRFKTLYNANLIGIITWGIKGELYEANDAFLNIIGYSRQDLRAGRLDWQRITPEDSRAADDRARQQLAERGYCEPFHKDYLHRDGRRVTVFIAPVLIDGRQDRGLAFVVDRTKEMQLEAELKNLAHFDPLTGLANRSLFADRLDRALVRAQRSQQMCALLFVDLDKFKPVNDQYGHAVGDQLLQRVAQRLLAAVRETDTVGRLGGDEFVAIIEGIDREASAVQIAKKMIAQLDEPFQVGERWLRVGCSIGISLYPQQGTDGVELMRAADAAMYVAKAAEDRHYAVFSPAN